MRHEWIYYVAQTEDGPFNCVAVVLKDEPSGVNPEGALQLVVNATYNEGYLLAEILRLAERVRELEEENRRLRDGLGTAASFGGGTTCPDGEPHRASCSRCNALLKMMPAGEAILRRAEERIAKAGGRIVPPEA